MSGDETVEKENENFLIPAFVDLFFFLLFSRRLYVCYNAHDLT